MTEEILEIAEIPQTLVARIQKGQCILFLGAGINIGCKDNPIYHYPDEHRPLQAKELAKELVKETDYKKELPNADDDDLKTAALWVETSKHLLRPHIMTVLTKHLREGKRPSHALRMLAGMPFTIFITTNFDNLLERALNDKDKDYTKFVYDPDPYKQTDDVGEDPTPERPLVFKMHGDLDFPDSIVITDEDYITFVQRMSDKEGFHPVPGTIRQRLRQWPTLFIGYSLQDYNLRLLFRSLRWRLDRGRFPNSYSVDLSPNRLILNVWQNQRQIISFFEDDLWRFIPRLYTRVWGKEYEPKT